MNFSSLCRNRGLFAAFATLGILSVRADYFDDFNSGTDTGWTHYEPLAGFGAPATYSFPSGAYQISVAGSPLPAVIGPGRGGSFRTDVVLSDFSVSYDLVAWGDTPIFAGALARMSNLGLGTSDGYALGFDFSDSTLFIGRVRGENVEAVVASTPVPPLDPSHQYRLTYSGVGPELSGSIRDLTTGTTLASVEGTDTAYTSGIVGLGVVVSTAAAPGVSGSATFDNFVAVAVPEPGALTLLAVGGAGGLWWGVRRKRVHTPR